jgi:hypothetical protein
MIDRGGIRYALILLAASVPVGCRKPPRADRLPTYPVTGRVLVVGQPAAGAEVQLWAVDGGLKVAGLCPHAIVGDDGRFHLTTYNTGDGAPEGEYGVTLRWPLPPPPGREQGPDRFQGRYADPAKPLQIVRIKVGENELEAIHID